MASRLEELDDEDDMPAGLQHMLNGLAGGEHVELDRPGQTSRRVSVVPRNYISGDNVREVVRGMLKEVEQAK